jgi:hypothetical protein
VEEAVEESHFRSADYLVAMSKRGSGGKPYQVS